MEDRAHGDPAGLRGAECRVEHFDQQEQRARYCVAHRDHRAERGRRHVTIADPDARTQHRAEPDLRAERTAERPDRGRPLVRHRRRIPPLVLRRRCVDRRDRLEDRRRTGCDFDRADGTDFSRQCAGGADHGTHCASRRYRDRHFRPGNGARFTLDRGDEHRWRGDCTGHSARATRSRRADADHRVAGASFDDREQLRDGDGGWGDCEQRDHRGTDSDRSDYRGSFCGGFRRGIGARHG